MRTSRKRLTLTVVAVLAGSSFAVVPNGPFGTTPSIAQVVADDPASMFTAAFNAYSQGEKEEALRLYRIAADLGHIGALWKLGRMYASGDGVDENPYEAYSIYQSMAQRHGDIPPNDRDAVFVASAFVTLAEYLRAGIEGQFRADDVAARNVYFYAASYFGDREAQYQLGRMLLNGEGGDADSLQAARWLKLASDKGHVAASAVLGEMLFDGNGVRARPTLGLSMLTRARHFARGDEREWIMEKQERAFAAATEEVRRAATEIASGEINSIGG